MNARPAELFFRCYDAGEARGDGLGLPLLTPGI